MNTIKNLIDNFKINGHIKQTEKSKLEELAQTITNPEQKKFIIDLCSISRFTRSHKDDFNRLFLIEPMQTDEDKFNMIKNIICKLSVKDTITNEIIVKLTTLKNSIPADKYIDSIKLIDEIIGTKSKKYSKKCEDKAKIIFELNDQLIMNVEDDIIEMFVDCENTEEFEKNLDLECDIYNKFSEKNPAECVTLKTKKYVYESGNINVTGTKKEMIEFAKNEFLRTTDFTKFRINKSPLKCFIYKQTKKFIIYKDANNNFIYDLNHILHMLKDDINVTTKRFQYINKIKYYSIYDNQCGGFYVKEFIAQSDMYDILLNSNCKFAKQFKKDSEKIILVYCRA